jgi:hypothetical protein
MLGIHYLVNLHIFLIFLNETNLGRVTIETYGQVSNFLDNLRIRYGKLCIKKVFVQRFELNLIKNLICKNPICLLFAFIFCFNCHLILFDAFVK